MSRFRGFCITILFGIFAIVAISFAPGNSGISAQWQTVLFAGLRRWVTGETSVLGYLIRTAGILAVCWIAYLSRRSVIGPDRIYRGYSAKEVRFIERSMEQRDRNSGKIGVGEILVHSVRNEMQPIRSAKCEEVLLERENWLEGIAQEPEPLELFRNVAENQELPKKARLSNS
jgi:hypothetical protein